MGAGIYYLSKKNIMKKECMKCGDMFNVKPSKANSKDFCSQKCRSNLITRPCSICGKDVTRNPSGMLSVVFCGMACASIGKRERFRLMNIEMNPDRMTPETRAKLREANLGKGEGKTYTKTYGRHTHRIVAEQKLGRPLKKGEVIHHKDENILNNDPDNLEVFASQSEHAKHHCVNGRFKRKE
jgi:endogenous inhibitor of DNA gyrase (YacG/DUF329 family)